MLDMCDIPFEYDEPSVRGSGFVGDGLLVGINHLYYGEDPHIVVANFSNLSSPSVVSTYKPLPFNLSYLTAFKGDWDVSKMCTAMTTTTTTLSTTTTTTLSITDTPSSTTSFVPPVDMPLDGLPQRAVVAGVHRSPTPLWCLLDFGLLLLP